MLYSKEWVRIIIGTWSCSNKSCVVQNVTYSCETIIFPSRINIAMVTLELDA